MPTEKGKLVLLCGIPGSGKSTFAKMYEPLKHHIILSSDSIREELCGDSSIQNRNHDVFKLLYKRMYYAICNGITVVFDATNISVKLRKKAIKSCPKDTEKWAVYFVPNVEKAKENNSKRERVVPEYVIERMAGKFVAPTHDEGFDRIWRIDGSQVTEE